MYLLLSYGYPGLTLIPKLQFAPSDTVAARYKFKEPSKALVWLRCLEFEHFLRCSLCLYQTSPVNLQKVSTDRELIFGKRKVWKFEADDFLDPKIFDQSLGSLVFMGSLIQPSLRNDEEGSDRPRQSF